TFLAWSPERRSVSSPSDRAILTRASSVCSVVLRTRTSTSSNGHTPKVRSFSKVPRPMMIVSTSGKNVSHTRAGFSAEVGTWPTSSDNSSSHETSPSSRAMWPSRLIARNARPFQRRSRFISVPSSENSGGHQPRRDPGRPSRATRSTVTESSPETAPLPSGQLSCLGCEGLGVLQRPLVKCAGRSAGDGFGGRCRVGVAGVLAVIFRLVVGTEEPVGKVRVHAFGKPLFAGLGAGEFDESDISTDCCSDHLGLLRAGQCLGTVDLVGVSFVSVVQQRHRGQIGDVGFVDGVALLIREWSTYDILGGDTWR